jgi:hypothetical protein
VCGIILMDTYHMLLRRVQICDCCVMHDRRKNTYAIIKDGRGFQLFPIKDKDLKK